MIPRTKTQNKSIHALLGKHGIDAETKAAMVERITNNRTSHTSQMSFAEANQLITELDGKPHDRSLRTMQYTRAKAGVVSMITSQQRERIKLLSVNRWGNNYSAPLQALCMRMLKKSEPVTSPDAQKVIEAIKAMNARDKQPPQAA